MEIAAAPSAPMEAPSADFAADGYYGGDMNMSVTESESQSGAVSGQKLIRTASLEMETMEFETTVQALESLVAEMKGYMESSNLRNRSSGYRHASFVIRIPAGPPPKIKTS